MKHRFTALAIGFRLGAGIVQGLGRNICNNPAMRLLHSLFGRTLPKLLAMCNNFFLHKITERRNAF